MQLGLGARRTRGRTTASRTPCRSSTSSDKFHDHLRDAPIGFTRAAGNFEAIDDDAVQAEPDRRSQHRRRPPGLNHVDNANMATPPDGIAPIMQMYLFNDPADPTDPFLQSNGGDEADIVYHEYTHGLSNRLVVDAERQLDAGQHPGRLDGRGLERLVRDGLPRSTRASSATPGRPARSASASYVGHGHDLIRTQPLDCPVGIDVQQVPRHARRRDRAATPTATSAGSSARPEVHADGEIWGETLWDLRGALGSKLTESLVTRAMELSPANPSYLDMRNSILQADQVVAKGSAPGRHLEGLRRPRHGLLRRRRSTATTPRRSRTSRCLRPPARRPGP